MKILIIRLGRKSKKSQEKGEEPKVVIPAWIAELGIPNLKPEEIKYLTFPVTPGFVQNCQN